MGPCLSTMSPSQLDETPSLPHPALLDKDVLFLILSQLLDDPAALAQLSVCACVCTAWREAVNDPRLWTSLTRWERLPRPPPLLIKGELAPSPAAAAVAGADSASVEGEPVGDSSADDDAYADQVNWAVLRRLVARSGGKLQRLDATPLGCVDDQGVLRALSDQGLEGKLESLRIDGVEIKAAPLSLAARSRTLERCLDSALAQISFLAGRHRWDTDDAAAGRRLAEGDSAKGIPPDPRFEAYLDPEPPADLDSAIATSYQRTHAKLASFLRKA